MGRSVVLTPLLDRGRVALAVRGVCEVARAGVR